MAMGKDPSMSALAAKAAGAAALEGEDPEMGEEDYDVDQDVFESSAAEAFPELADDPARMAAFKACIEACVRKSSSGDEEY